MKNLFMILVLFQLLFQQYGQAQPGILWENTFGGTFTDKGINVIPTTNGNYFALGKPYSIDGDVSGGHGEMDFWLVKLDTLGQMIWQKSFGGSGDDNPFDIIPTPDNCCLLIGSTSSNDGDIDENNGNSDVWILKVDQDGAIVWQRTYGGSDTDYGGNIIPTNDGGYLMTAWASSTNFDVPQNLHGFFDLWVIKIDGNGNIIWSKLYGGTGFEGGGRIVPMDEGGFLISSRTGSNNGDIPPHEGGGFSDSWVIRIDSVGTIIWNFALGGDDNEYPGCILPTADGGFLVLGSTPSLNGSFSENHGSFDLWAYKLSADGDFEWQKFYGGSGLDFLNDAIRLEDGKIIIVAHSGSNNGDLAGENAADAWMLCISEEDGHILWSKTYGGSQDDDFFRIEEISPGEFIVAGYSASNDGDVLSGKKANFGDVWIVRLSNLISSASESQKSVYEIVTSPNPAMNFIDIYPDEKLEHSTVVIYDPGGVVCTQRLLTAAGNRIDISNLTAGTYVLEIQGDRFKTSKIFIKI